MLLVSHHLKFQDSSWQICILEKALGIKEEATASWREQYDIPGSESLLEMMQAKEVQKRERSDTMSTAFSDSHDSKRARIYAIPE